MTGRRGIAVALTAALTTLVVVGGPAPAALAHPLGNATVNHYDGLLLSQRGVDDLAVEDIAEIPTLQRRPAIDADSDDQLSPAERATYATRRCAALASSIRLTAGGAPLAVRVTSASYAERPGVIGLTVGRL